MGKRLNLFLFILILISFSANAETYKLQCIYEVGGNKSITIDEQNSKVINTPGGSWNFRKVSEYVYVYEVASLQKQTINRYIGFRKFGGRNNNCKSNKKKYRRNFNAQT